ncbi:MAG: DUF4166 domain-containing protein [Rhodospirillaceae bacterium]|nr:DUF4166 domain-containing protein [Rhodospirillaceae bacterium]
MARRCDLPVPAQGLARLVLRPNRRQSLSLVRPPRSVRGAGTFASGSVPGLNSVLIIGGSGTFGSRALRLLAKSGQFRLIIGGRDAAKAQLLIQSLPDGDIHFAQFDRKGDVDGQLRHLAPWAVIDAAGPFQDASPTRYAVPEACIRHGIHYIDLADSRAFVLGIDALDSAARTAGVAVLSGASSVPALSMAVVDRLATDLTHVAAIDIALSASNRATAGPSVNAAILSYIGQPIRIPRMGIWIEGYGWQYLARKSFSVRGRRPIKRRLVGLCDVPDLDLLPRRYPEAGRIIFRAGAELFVQNVTLWLLSFAVRWRLLKSLSPFAPFINRLQKLTGFLGSDRSAMSVSVTGSDISETAAEYIWTLIAEDGHGPWVPSFASVLLVQKLAAGKIPVGAGPAIGLLSLLDFEPLFAQFHLFSDIRRTDLPSPLYARVLGPAFMQMPKPVQAMHSFVADAYVTGRGRVRRGDDPVARLLGWMIRFPPAQEDVPVAVTFTIAPTGEIWQRDFAGHRFSSRLSSRVKNGQTILTETFWPLTFDFHLRGDADGLEMEIQSWRLLGLPLPGFLAPRIDATEQVRDGLFYFDVRIALPWGPLIVHYQGDLERDHARQP